MVVLRLLIKSFLGESKFAMVVKEVWDNGLKSCHWSFTILFKNLEGKINVIVIWELALGNPLSFKL